MTALMRDCIRCQLVTRTRPFLTIHKVYAHAAHWYWAKRVLAALAFLALASTVGTRTAAAQLAITFAVDSPATSGDKKPVSSFSLPTQSSSVKEAIEEFQRFVEHEAWEKAFQSLETITSKSTEGFIERPDQVLVPSRLLVRSLLAGMPTAGKSAYRVFYDAQATALWEKATGAAEIDSLTQIVDNHLVSSVGDRAADRLGDLYFERGDLHRAQTAWRTVLNYCPESEISKAQLLIKVATALALAGRGGELGDIQRAIGARYANETVVVAGRPVKAGEEIERLAGGLQNNEAVTENAGLDDFELPTSDEALWQFRFQSKVDPNNPAAAAQPFPIMNVYGQPRANDFPIPVATDGGRVYLNTFGVEMAFDLATGKMLWRTGRMHELNFQQNRQGALPERYSILVAGDRTWSVTREPSQMNQQPPTFSLVARDAATGKDLFNSRRTLSTWSIVGSPLLARNPGGSNPGGNNAGGNTPRGRNPDAGSASVADRVMPSADVIYVGASRSNKSAELSLLEIDAQSFKLKRDVTLGTHAVDPNQVYYDRVSEPTFAMQRDRLYVDTHAGALLALRRETAAIEWGILYESPPPQSGYPSSMYQPSQFGTSGPLVAGGLLFTKGMRSPRMLALDPAGPTLSWRRPIGVTAVLVGADDKYLYTGGEELAAYDLQTQELVWSTRLPMSAGWSMPVLTKTRIYQFTSRGIYQVNKQTGQVMRLFRGADLDALGGSLFVTPTALVTVSNVALTAYPLDGSASLEDAASLEGSGGDLGNSDEELSAKP